MIARGAWGLVAAGLLGRLVHRQARLHRMLRGRREVEDAAVLSMLAELRRNAGVWTPVRLTSSDAAPTPLALGAAEICVPIRFLSDLRPEEQRGALAHELAHVARRDPAWHLAAGVLEAVFFFQPLNRVARLRLREAAEYLCDDWAVRQTGSPLGLARCLAEVAGWLHAGRDPIPAGTMAMAEGGSPLSERVRRLLGGGTGETQPRRAATRLAALLLLAGVTFLAPGVAPFGKAALASLSSLGRDHDTDAEQEVEVIGVPHEADPLPAKWAWAREEARKRGKRTYWIAYSFPSVLKDGAATVSDTEGFELGDLQRTPLSTILETPENVVVMLFRMQAGSDEPTRIAARSASVGMDFGRDPVFCLGPEGVGESFEWLRERADAFRDPDRRAHLVEAIALHPATDKVVPYLRGRLTGDGSADVRSSAAEGLAYHPGRESMMALRQAVDQDGSKDVRLQAVEALGDLRLPDAGVLLKMLVNEHPDEEIRVQAVEALAKYDPATALESLDELVQTSRDARVRIEAGESLGAVAGAAADAALRRIAWTHPDMKTRRQAAETMSVRPTAFAVPALDSIAWRHPDAWVARQAVESLGNIEEPGAAERLRRIAASHPNPDLRREARDQLATLSMRDPDPDPDEPDHDPDPDPDPAGRSRAP